MREAVPTISWPRHLIVNPHDPHLGSKFKLMMMRRRVSGGALDWSKESIIWLAAGN